MEEMKKATEKVLVNEAMSEEEKIEAFDKIMEELEKEKERDRVRKEGSRHDVQNAKIIEVIETMSLRGTGSKGDPVRPLMRYWDFKGKLLAEKDCIN